MVLQVVLTINKICTWKFQGRNTQCHLDIKGKSPCITSLLAFKKLKTYVNSSKFCNERNSRYVIIRGSEVWYPINL